jgi:hypothetical protein
VSASDPGQRKAQQLIAEQPQKANCPTNKQITTTKKNKGGGGERERKIIQMYTWVIVTVQKYKSVMAQH